MCIKYWLALVLVAGQVYADGAEPVVLTEKTLLSMVDATAPTILQLDNQLEKARISHKEFSDRFNPQVFAQGTYRRTHEEPFIAFQPIISPQSIFEAGVQKQFKGITTVASLGVDNRSFEFNGNLEQPSIGQFSLRISMDVWANFLGRLDNQEENALIAYIKQSETYRVIGEHAFWLSLRSMYWNAAMAQEKQYIAEQMLGLAKQQAKDAELRYKSGAADLAEVSLYRAQLSSRASEVMARKFELQNSLYQLRRSLPSLTSQPIEVAAPNQIEARLQLMECVQWIERQTEVPLADSQYAQLMEQIDKYHAALAQSAERYNAPHVSLDGEVFARAVDPSAPSALGEAVSRDRQGFSIGVGVTVPLGGTDTQRRKVRIEELEARRQKLEIYQDLQGTFVFIKNSIRLLLELLDNQQTNIASLQTRISAVESKFNQGRVSLSDYIADQDMLLQSHIALIDNTNQMIQALLDYFALFSGTPCSFNRV